MLVWKTALDLAPRCPAVNRPKTRILARAGPLPTAPRRVVGTGRTSKGGCARGPDHRTARRPPFRAPPGPRPRARRQVDLAPRPDPRRADGRAKPASPACSRARTSSTPARRCARSAQPSNAPGRAPGGSTGSGSRASRSRPRRSISAIPAPAAAWSSGRSRAARSPRPSTAMPRCARGRCGACSTRSSAWARGPRASPRAAACRSRSPGARDPIPIVYRAAGRLRAAQIRGAARRPRGAGRDRGDRAGGDARPHRAHAAPFRRDRAGRARRRARPPHHAHRPAGARRPRRSTVPADPSSAAFPLVAGADRAGLRGDPRRRHAQPAAHRPVHDPARDGRGDRGARSRATRAARTSPTCACAPARCSGVDGAARARARR